LGFLGGGIGDGLVERCIPALLLATWCGANIIGLFKISRSILFPPLFPLTGDL
jgi:hypothetical protein